MSLSDGFPKRIKPATATSDGLLTATDKAQLDNLFDMGIFGTATSESDGLMAKEDKTKLDTIEEYANNYKHPNDTNSRHVSDAQISNWNSSTGLVTQTSNGILSKEDKIKLDGIATGATNYVHPNNANIRHVTDVEKATWNAKASIDIVTITANGLMSKEDKTKLNGIATNANNYVHPTSHVATMISEDATHRFVSDTEKATWNAKASIDIVTITANGLMSKEDKTKLNGIATNANNYVHPTTSGNKHIPAGGLAGQLLKYSTDGTAVWVDEKIYPDVTTTSNGLMIKEDKIKLDSMTGFKLAHTSNISYTDPTNTINLNVALNAIVNGSLNINNTNFIKIRIKTKDVSDGGYIEFNFNKTETINHKQIMTLVQITKLDFYYVTVLKGSVNMEFEIASIVKNYATDLVLEIFLSL